MNNYDMCGGEEDYTENSIRKILIKNKTYAF